MIVKVIFWNIRSVNTQNSFGRLMDLNMRHHYSFIALMEPFQDPSKLEHFKNKLGFDKALANCSGKIWTFLRDDWEGTIMMDSIQQLTLKFYNNNFCYIISSVYARCSSVERLELWEELTNIAEDVHVPWMVGGDFNVILKEEEKLGGLAFT